MVHVRQRGAIGVFYNQTFSVTTAANVNSREQVRNAWYNQHGDKWEPHHYVSITEK